MFTLLNRFLRTSQPAYTKACQAPGQPFTSVLRYQQFHYAKAHIKHFSTTTPFVPMPVVEAVAQVGKGLVNFKQTAFFGIQHILDTNTTLFKYLVELGADPKNIFLSGKGYSDSESAEEILKNNLGVQYFKLDPQYEKPGYYQRILRAHLKGTWATFADSIKHKPIQKIVVFDEGGHCFETMPEELCLEYSMVGIEQTRGGLYSPAIDLLPFPLIAVASSALKRHIESPLIIEAMLKKLENLMQKISLNKVCGVIGNGAIGSSLTRFLLDAGYKVVVFDQNPYAFPNFKDKKFYRMNSAQEVFIRSNYIFGCTGKNILPHPESLEGVSMDKTFISCTSEDKEFQGLLKKCSNSHRLNGEIAYTTSAGGRMTIVNRGFPVNFDHSGESVPAGEIQLTRALMLSAFIEGSRQDTCVKGEGKINRTQHFMPHPVIQQFIARRFKEFFPENNAALKTRLEDKWAGFENLDWIAEHSEIENSTTFENNPLFNPNAMEISNDPELVQKFLGHQAHKKTPKI